MNPGIRYSLCVLVVSYLTLNGVSSTAAENQQENTVHVPAFQLPVSSLLSPETQEILRHSDKDLAPCPSIFDPANLSVEAMKAVRACSAQKEKPHLEKMLKRFGVTIQAQTIGGVPTEIFMPEQGVSPANAHRVLINLHGGGFVTGTPRPESIPIAGLGKIKVVGVDYRMGPEHKFPAASEDSAAVYAALLKEYAPSNIGIYGCSAGARLTAQSMAWFQKAGLPNPGAIVLSGAGASGGVDGDSAYIVSAIVGINLVGHIPLREAYFGKNPDLRDPLLAPLSSPGVMAKFPPTLLISSTRDWGLSNVVRTHTELVKLAVPADLHVWEGLGHCFFLDPELSESREVYSVILNFFGSQLGKDS